MAAPTSQPPQLGPTLPPTSHTTSHHTNQSPPSKSPIDFSPPLIAMVILAAAAFLFITYSRLISRHLFPPFLRLFRRRRRRFLYPPSTATSPPPAYESSDGFYFYSPYGLDDAVIKTIPLTIYNLSFLEFSDNSFNDCAVCLLEFEDGERIRTLPHCCHSFHVDCIDMWLRSHATCPLCRAGVYIAPPPLESSPLSPLMAARVRPSFDEGILLESVFLEPLHEIEIETDNTGEIQQVAPPPVSPEISIQSEDHRHHQCRDFLLKRSYSFGFERSSPSEDATATTPYHHHRQRRSFFWTKRPSSTPFSSLAAKSRVFSFRRNFKSSPGFFRRRGFFPMSESSAVGSSRRVMMKPLASPLFGRGGVFSSSRMRMGDPEALISPERYNRR